MKRERKHIRLRNFDYSSEGAYFITANTANKAHFFGEIENEKLILSETGKIADEYLLAIPEHFSNAYLDEYQVMPDHIHCIIFLISETGHELMIVPPLKGIDLKFNLETEQKATVNQFAKPVKGSISVIIQQFKASVTKRCNRSGLRFAWQERFHDHVIRSEAEYQRIKQYIQDNPKNWKS